MPHYAAFRYAATRHIALILRRHFAYAYYAAAYTLFSLPPLATPLALRCRHYYCRDATLFQLYAIITLIHDAMPCHASALMNAAALAAGQPVTC